MTFKDRLRRLRKHSPSNSAAPSLPADLKSSSPANVSPGTHSTSASTGQATPAATQTPTAAISSPDLTTINSSTHQLTNAATIEEALQQKAATKAALPAGEKKKKRRGLFRKKEDPYKDWPEDVYKPHEVPAPKYKRTPDPKHIENLSAFSFGAGGGGFGVSKLVRRFSQQSGISPGGSKVTSPFGSKVNSRAPSRLASANPSRNPSIAEEVEEDGISKANGLLASPGKQSRPGQGARGVSTKTIGRGLTMQAHDVDRVAEEDGEADSENAGGMSRPRTAQDDRSAETEMGHRKTDSKSSHDMPFTEQELTQALSRATLRDNIPKVVATPPS